MYYWTKSTSRYVLIESDFYLNLNSLLRILCELEMSVVLIGSTSGSRTALLGNREEKNLQE